MEHTALIPSPVTRVFYTHLKRENKKNLVPYCMHKIFHVCLYHFLINLVSTHSELRIRMFAAKTP